jgi:hypothetical protein
MTENKKELIKGLIIIFLVISNLIIWTSVIKSCYAKKPQQDFAKKDVTVL